MFFIERGTVTLERMRNLGPGNSPVSTSGPLDQGKNADMNILVCELACTSFAHVLCFQNLGTPSVLRGAEAGAYFVYAHLCTHACFVCVNACMHVITIFLTHRLEQETTFNRPKLSLPANANTQCTQLPAVLLGSYACSLTSASTAMKPPRLKVNGFKSRVPICSIPHVGAFARAPQLLIVLHARAALVFARVRGQVRPPALHCG